MSEVAASTAIAKSLGKRTLIDRETVAVADMKPSDIGKAVRVRVYRKWIVTDIRGTRQPMLSFILLDRQGGAIQANVDPRERGRFDTVLQMNATYKITGFGLQDTKRWMQTLPNRLKLILGRFTDAQPFTENGFPLHHFNFVAYNEAAQRADNNNTILTDYIGCVTSVGDVQEKGNAAKKTVVWRDIMLRNLEGDTIRFTLWNEQARGFDTNEYQNASKPAVMAVSSCWVKTYAGLQLLSTPATYYYLNPNIPETDYILSMYNEVVAPPVIQNVRTYRYEDPEQEKLRNRVTIDELLREDPRNQTNVRFTVVATIAEISNERPWYFQRCRDCRHKIYNNFPHAHCEPPNPEEPNDYSFRAIIFDKTGELTLTCFSDAVHILVTECAKVISELDYTNPYAPPPILTALEGTTHLFQLHFSPESTREKVDYILDTVMETGTHLLPPTQTGTVADEGQSSEPTQTLLLTGPETETQDTMHMPIAGQQTLGTPPATSPPSEMPQTSTPATTEYTHTLRQRVAKDEEPKPSARRQLLKDGPKEEAGSSGR